MRHRLLTRLLVSGLFLLFAASLLASGPAHAEPGALILNGPLAETRLAPHVSRLCDRSGQLTLADVRAQQFSPPPESLAFGYRKGACWLRFRLANQSAQPLDLLVLLRLPVLDLVELHAPGATTDYWRTGDSLPFTQRPLANRNFIFPLTLPAGQEQEFFLRVSTSSAMNLPLSVVERQHHLAVQENSNWLQGIIYGAIIGLLLYHLFLWIAVRERIYRFYVLYGAAALAYLLCFQGFAYQLWPESPRWNAHAQLLFVFLTLAFAALFTRDYLNTADLNTGGSPRTDRLLVLVASLAGGMAVLQFVLPAMPAYQLQGILGALTGIIILGVGIQRWHRGLPQARLFVLAWGLLIVTTLLLSLQNFTLLAIPIDKAFGGMELGLVLQQLLLAFGLADRVNRLKGEKQEQAKATLRAQAENAAKSEFLAKMSHEIRTPMNALLGITQLLQDTPLDNTQRNYVETLNNSGHALLHVINDILDYSKIAAGKVTLENIDFDLHALLDECVRVFSLNAQEKSLSLVCTVAPEIPACVRGDPNRLRQVLLNLLSNAVKFTARGRVELRVNLLESPDDHHLLLQFEVEDSGIGIAPEKMDSLFNWFTQADSSTSREYGGTGLGLTISRQLVSLMGGDISARSRSGEGTCFRFTAQLTPGLRPLPAARNADGLLPSFSRLRVLVVEDNPINQMVIGGLLRKLGIQPRLASSGVEAVDLMREGHDNYDLVLMDCEMPRLDGYDTTRAIRALERHLGQRRLCIVALTAHALPEHRSACLAAGMDDYLSKPLLLPTLVNLLQNHFGAALPVG